MFYSLPFLSFKLATFQPLALIALAAELLHCFYLLCDIKVEVHKLCGKCVVSYCVFSGTMPLTMQEQALVEDLLYVLIGVDGRDIAAQPVLGRQSRTFIVDPSLDMSIKELVNRILPVASCYSTVTRLVKLSV